MMRSLVLSTSLLMVVGAACGGKTPPPGSPTKLADAPEWVHKGTRVGKGEIVGVGAASGMKNPELLRVTASNRGRNEIAKVLEVYSASLMKDYQESVSAGQPGVSSESQMVTNAIKTYSAQLLEGTEVQGYWLDPTNGTQFALVVLNFERQKDIASAKADMPGSMKDWVAENGPKVLAELESEGKGPPAAAPVTPTEAPDDAAPSAPTPAPAAPAPAPSKPASAGPEPRKGDAPAWTKGNGGACDTNRYLCGVGTGRDVTTADINARAELARIFEANIKSVATSFEGAARKISSSTGEQWIEAQKVTSFSMVSTEKVLRMSTILDRWQDAQAKSWTLAVIDRAQAGTALREEIEQKDSIVDAALGRAEGSEDKLARFTALKQASQALLEREAMNSDLRVIEKSGQGVPGRHSIGDVIAMLEGAAADLSIGAAISGSGADKVQACLEQALTAKGYQVAASSTEEDDEDPDVSGKYDVVLKGTVKAEKRGQIAGSEVVNVELTLKLINGSTNKVLRTFTASRKGSRGDLKSAASTAATQLCNQKIPEVVKGIDEYFGKKK
jgi:hypothetical protein